MTVVVFCNLMGWKWEVQENGYPALKKTKALCHVGSLKSRGYTNLSWRVRKVRMFSNT